MSKKECSICGKLVTDLARHMRSHDNKRPYVCDQCGIGFIKSSHLMRHKRTHSGERPYVCDQCGEGFNQSSDLMRHKRTHSGERPYVCDQCGEGFNQSSNLMRHKRTIHRIDFIMGTRGSMPTNVNRCAYCAEKLTDSDSCKECGRILCSTCASADLCMRCVSCCAMCCCDAWNSASEACLVNFISTQSDTAEGGLRLALVGPSIVEEGRVIHAQPALLRPSTLASAPASWLGGTVITSRNQGVAAYPVSVRNDGWDIDIMQTREAHGANCTVQMVGDSWLGIVLLRAAKRLVVPPNKMLELTVPLTQVLLPRMAASEALTCAGVIAAASTNNPAEALRIYQSLIDSQVR